MRSLTALLMLMLMTLPGVSRAQSPASDSVRARAIVELSLAAHGGRRRFEAARAVEAVATGDAWMLGQSVHPEGPLDVEPVHVLTVRSGDRMLQEVTNHYRPDFVLGFREVIRDTSGFVIEPTRVYQGSRLDWTPADNLPMRRARLHRALGPFLIASALQHGSGFALLPPEGHYDRVRLNDGSGELVLRFDRGTRLLDGYEITWLHPVGGRRDHRVKFGDYHRVNGLTLPGTRDETWNGDPAARYRLAWRLDHRADDSLFAVPAGFREITGDTTHVIALGGGAWRLNFADGSTGLAMEFASALVVVEAPGGSPTSEDMLAALAVAFPGKPVRYVTFTHHHSDHAAGIRAYIARGIPVLVPESYAQFVRDLAAVSYGLMPDSLEMVSPRNPGIVTFRGEHTIREGDRSLTLYDIPNSHSAASVVAFVPSIGLLADGDGFMIHADTPVLPAYALMRETVAGLERLGVWQRVVTILNTHAGTVDPARVRAALALPVGP